MSFVHFTKLLVLLWKSSPGFEFWESSEDRETFSLRKFDPATGVRIQNRMPLKTLKTRLSQTVIWFLQTLDWNSKSCHGRRSSQKYRWFRTCQIQHQSPLPQVWIPFFGAREQRFRKNILRASSIEHPKDVGVHTFALVNPFFLASRTCSNLKNIHWKSWRAYKHCRQIMDWIKGLTWTQDRNQLGLFVSDASKSSPLRIAWMYFFPHVFQITSFRRRSDGPREFKWNLLQLVKERTSETVQYELPIQVSSNVTREKWY